MRIDALVRLRTLLVLAVVMWWLHVHLREDRARQAAGGAQAHRRPDAASRGNPRWSDGA